MATPALPLDPSATPQVPVETPAAAPSTTPPAAPSWPTEGFKVNDRVVYKTPDDAIKGWNELDKFRQQYSDFTNRVKNYGVDNPDSFWQSLDLTLAELKKLQDAAAPAQPQPVTQEQVAQMLARQREQQALQSRIDGAINYGRSTLKELMASAKLPTEDDDVAWVYEALEGQVVKRSRDEKGNLVSGSLEDRFINGTDADRKAIIEQEFKRFAKFHQIPAAAANAEYAAQKTAAIAAQPKTIPAANGSIPAGGGKRPSESEVRQNLLAILSRQ